MANSIVSFDPEEVGKEEKEKFGQALKDLANENVDIDNFQNFLRRVKSRSSQIKDDIKELQKENARIQEQLDNLKDDVSEEKLEAYRQDGNKDLKEFSIDVKTSLAYQKHRNLKKIESKRSYKTAHWRLVAWKLEEILDDLGTIDDVVKRHTGSVQAELVKELDRTEDEVVDTVEETTDSLSREHGTITRRIKSLIQMMQELAQYMSFSGIQDVYTEDLSDDDEETEPEDSEEEGSFTDSSSDDRKKSGEEKNRAETNEDTKEKQIYKLKNKSPNDKKRVLDRMVNQVEGLEMKSKEDIVELVDVSRQMLYYSGDHGGIIGKVEKEFPEAEYPELK